MGPQLIPGGPVSEYVPFLILVRLKCRVLWYTHYLCNLRSLFKLVLRDGGVSWGLPLSAQLPYSNCKWR